MSSKWPLAPATLTAHVVAHHLGADLGQRLALGRVDLAGHDGRARLVGRQDQFAQARARAGPEKPDVVGDLHRADGQHVEHARGLDQGVVRGQGLELVRRGLEGQAGDLGDLFGEPFGKTRFGVQARADGGAALRQFQRRGSMRSTRAMP